MYKTRRLCEIAGQGRWGRFLDKVFLDTASKHAKGMFGKRVREVWEFMRETSETD